MNGLRNSLFGNPFLIGGAASAPYNLEVEAQRRAMEQRQQYTPQCIHTNCPICIEQAKRQAKMRKEMELLAQERKDDYKKRCDDYLRKFKDGA